MEFDPKYLLDIDYFQDKIARHPISPSVVLCGARCLGDVSEINPITKYQALKEFIKNCVVGVGLYQGVEFVLQEGVWGLLKKTGLAMSRLRNSWKVISQAKTFSFIIGSDRDRNIRTLLDFLRSTLK